MSSRDVTGRWEGIFNYPRGMAPNGFAAELVEQAGAITGETHERSDEGASRGETLVAIVEGERVGSAVRFTKRYDELARAHYAVRYDGTLSPEGDEITGEWTIPGVWSGSFIMVRERGRDEPVEEVVGEEVR